jgi:hypothetical protein
MLRWHQAQLFLIHPSWNPPRGRALPRRSYPRQLRKLRDLMLGQELLL